MHALVKPAQQRKLVRADPVHAGLAQERHGREQARDAVAVARTGFKSCRILLRLGLPERLHARPADAPRRDLHVLRHAQPAGPLRPHEALVAGETENADVHALHVDRENARRLRRVHHKQKSVCGAERADPLQIQKIPRQV